jgi:hypothetical protein
MARTEQATLNGDGGQLIRKILITALAGGGAFLVTNLTDQPQSWSLVLSLLIGGITLLVQFLVDLEIRQRSVEEHVDSLGRTQGQLASQLRLTLNREIAKISDATALYDRLERSGLEIGSLARLVHLVADLADERESLAYKVVSADVDKVVAFLEQLRHGGAAAYDGEDADWLLSLTEAARHSLDATSRASVALDGSGFVDEGFWETELSHRYLERQRAAIRRGVKVRRIFVLETEQLVQHFALRQICDQQTAMGMEVRLLDASKLTASQRLMLPDLVVFDEEVSYELISGPRIGAGAALYYIKTSLVVQPRVVRERIQLFADLWELSVAYA